MTRYRPLFSAMLLASSLAGFAAPVAAAPYDCGPNAQRGDFFEHRGEQMEAHHRKLLAALKLSPDQDAAWKKLVASEGPMPMERPAMAPQDWARLTTPERSDKMLERMKEHLARRVDHGVALKEFYSLLRPEQKQTFDDFHAAPAPRMHGKHDRRQSDLRRAAPR